MAGRNKTINEKYNSPFAKSIRSLMEERGMTQDELAQAVGRTRQTVSQYVNGISEPGYDTLVKIADSFNVSVDFLLGRTEVKTTDITIQSIVQKTGLTEKNIESLMKRGPYGHEYPGFAESYEKMTNDLISYASTYTASRTYHRFLYNANFEPPELEQEAGHNHTIVEYTVVAKVISGIPEDGVNYAKGYTAISPNEYAKFLLDEFSGDFKNYLRNIYFESYIGGVDHGHH